MFIHKDSNVRYKLDFCHKKIQEICDHCTSIRIIILLSQDLFSNYQEQGYMCDICKWVMNKVLHSYFEKRME